MCATRKAQVARLLVMAAAGLAAAGCLVMDTTETWYLDAAGGVTWVVEEKDVRSDAEAAVDRHNEESTYWLAVQQERHPVAAGLRELGGDKLRTMALRAEVPYTVRTDAKFAGLDALGQRLISAIGATGTSIVTRNGETWEWAMTVRDPSATGAVAEPSEGVGRLVDGLGKLTVVLVSGRFERAEGFSLSKDRRLASFDEAHFEDTTENAVVTLRLVWTTR